MSHSINAGAINRSAVDMPGLLKRVVKQFVVTAIQPPVRGCANLIQRVLMMEVDSTVAPPSQEFVSTLDYLNYWQRRIVAELRHEIGDARLSGVSAGRPHYVWGVLNGVYLAQALGFDRVSAIEFGVAGGNGLVTLELIADKMRRYFGVEVDVYGFDAGLATRGRPTIATCRT